jgi:hypothetical protein
VTRASKTLGTITGRVELVLADHVRDRHRRGQRHLLGELLGAHVEHAAEHAGEGQHVVDLVGLVGAAGRDHAACLRASRGSTSGSGLASANTIDFSAILAMSSPVSRFGRAHADEHVGADDRAGQVAE